MTPIEGQADAVSSHLIDDLWVEALEAVKGRITGKKPTAMGVQDLEDRKYAVS